MKKYIYWLLCTLLFCGYTSQVIAYTPTEQDINRLNQLKATLDTINSGNVKDIRNFMQQIKEIQPLVNHEPKIAYLLQELQTHLHNQFSTAKIKTKQSSKSDWIKFLEQNNTGIIEITMDDKCFWRYNTIDNISFANNFPTALTMAIRYRESHCGYYLPKNTNWPFQIISKNYWTGEITEKIFFTTVQDFIDFSKAKLGKYKSKVYQNISYTGTDIKSIVSYAALYNGWYISWDKVIPNAPKYVYEWYSLYNSWEFASWTIRHGILAKFIKTLEYEINTHY